MESPPPAEPPLEPPTPPSANQTLDMLRSPTGRAAMFHAVFVGSVVILKSATNALYLSNRDPAGLPLLYITVAALVAVATAILGGPLGRMGASALLPKVAWGSTALVAGLCGAYALGFPEVLGGLYVLGELYATAVSILFWSTVSGWFDARSARRAFGLISAGGMAGSMVGGLAVRALVLVTDSSGMAALSVLCTAAALPLLALGSAASPHTAQGQGFRAGASYLWNHSFPRAVAALAATYSALGALVDYVFRAESAHRLTEPQLASLFGDLNAAVGLAAILYQLVVSAKVLERGGLFLFLGVVPALLAVASVGAAVTGWFGVIILVKALEMAGSYSIQQSGMQLLYNPMPAEARAPVRAFVDGVVKKAGMALSGVVLALVVSAYPKASSPWMVAVLAVGCLLLIRWLRDAYLVALEDKLRGSRAAVVVPSIDVEDKVTRAVLLRALTSESAPQVMAALAILQRDPKFLSGDHLQRLLTHDDETVRLAALDLVTLSPPPDVEFTLSSILALDTRRPRAAAARALARCRPDKAPVMLMPYLEDPDPGVACAVVAALWSHPETADVAKARLDALLAHGKGASVAQRREVARLLGELPVGVGVAALPAFVEDGDATVRLAALQAAARLNAAAVASNQAALALQLVPVLQSRLAHRPERPSARAALVCLGDAVVPLLRANLDDRAVLLAIRIEIPRLLRGIGTADAAQTLLFSNIQDHPSLRYRIAESLFQLRRFHPEVPIDLPRTNEALLRRLHGFAHYRPLCHALASADATAPRAGPARRAWDVLRHVTQDRLLQNLEMAAHLLGLHRGAERMDRAGDALIRAEVRALEGAGPEELRAMRADALEVLDVALAGDDLRDEVMRVLEPLPPARANVNVPWRDVADTARALRASRDPLVSGLARRVLRSGVLAPEEASSPLLQVHTQPPSDAAVDAVSDPTDLEEIQNMDEALVTRILTLEQVDLFRGLPVDDVAAIAGIAEELHADAGEVLYKEGDTGDNMMVLVSGRVKLMRSGKEFMALGPGESLGQVSLLDRGPRPTTAVVAKEGLGAELLSIRCDAFMDLVADRPELQRGLFVVLAQRLRALIDLTARS